VLYQASEVKEVDEDGGRADEDVRQNAAVDLAKIAR